MALNPQASLKQILNLKREKEAIEKFNLDTLHNPKILSN